MPVTQPTLFTESRSEPAHIRTWQALPTLAACAKWV